MLSVQNLSKTFGGFMLRDINLEINRGDYFVLLGPSGAGKTILFETLAGINIPDSGKIIFNGKDITNEKIRRRKLGLVFQDGAVFPHMTVKQNIGFPLRIKNIRKEERDKIIERIAGQMDIARLLHRKPDTLSGGELRRVAIARTLALEPDCLMLDEPLSSIDVQLRDEILFLLKRLNQNGLTMLHITHDYREAFYLANKMAVIDKGKIIQQGTPSEIVAKPGSKFIAGFIGIKNYFDFKSANDFKIVIEGLVHLKFQYKVPQAGKVAVHQQSIRVLTGAGSVSEMNSFEGQIINCVHFPDHTEITADIGIPLQIVVTPAMARDISRLGSVRIGIDPEKIDFI